MRWIIRKEDEGIYKWVFNFFGGGSFSKILKKGHLIRH